MTETEKWLNHGGFCTGYALPEVTQRSQQLLKASYKEQKWSLVLVGKGKIVSKIMCGGWIDILNRNVLK